MTARRLGVFICYCGGNISDYVDVERVREEAEQEPEVLIAQTNTFTCSDAGQQNIVQAIQEQHLDGIVVASCSPKLHLNTFRATAQRAGLNPYAYTQVNIREQCSWAHTHDKPAATATAIRLVRGGIARTALSRPLEKLRVDTTSHALVIGAGVAGLRAALALSDLGIAVHLIERAGEPGGMAGRWGKLFPTNRSGSQLVSTLVEQVRRRDTSAIPGRITLLTHAELVEKSGHVGDFTVKVALGAGRVVSLQVGSIIVATGFETYSPPAGEYGFGLDGVLTLPEFKELQDECNPSGKPEGLMYKGRQVRTITYIYCVGSRQHAAEEGPDDERAPGTAAGRHPYCSRYCCTATVHTALCVDDLHAGIHQFHLFRDMRTYGKYEALYDRALQQGSVFLRYDEQEPPQVTQENGRLVVRVKDRLTRNEEVQIATDLVVLVTGMLPRENSKLIDVLKLPVGKDGFLNEIHPKLRPVETVIDGVFIAGAAQGPKTLAESVASAMAAVAKTSALLLKGYVDLEPLVAKVDPAACTGCGACLEACPYDAIELVPLDGKQVAAVSAVLCKGAGACVPVCEQQALTVEGYTNQQVESMIDALVKEVA